MDNANEITLSGGPYDSTKIAETVNGIPVGDKPLTAAFLASMIASLITDGVVASLGGGLECVPAGGLNIKVKSGTAWARGYMARLDADTSFALVAGNNYNVFVRQSYAEGEAVLCVGEESTPTRREGVFDLVIAKVRIPAGALTVSSAMIIDTRAEPSLCGYVSSRTAAE